MLNKNIEEKLDDIIFEIKKSIEYKKCIKIKKKMDTNDELKKIINNVKSLQKKYVRENTEEIKKELDQQEKLLNEIPIYVEYNQNLELVNKKINFVKDELNDYFFNKIN